MSDIENRITGYLCSGGMWNPELAIHDRVRDLLIDCRHEIARLLAEVERLRAAATNHDAAPAARAEVAPGTGQTPTLTDAERGALESAIEVADSLAECSGAGTGGAPSPEAATLRALLARLGGAS